MFAEYEYDYDRLVEESDDLLVYDDYNEQSDWEDYYHNLAEDIE